MNETKIFEKFSESFEFIIQISFFFLAIYSDLDDEFKTFIEFLKDLSFIRMHLNKCFHLNGSKDFFFTTKWK
jgi:hypothetical protein